MGESGDGAKGSRKMGLSAEEIKKVKEEWEEKQKQKKDKEKDKAKEKEKEKDGSKDKKETTTTDQASTSTPSAPQTPAPAHQRYTLHRDFFAMRLAEHRKRRNVAQAKELAPRLPIAPRDALPDPSTQV
jgi:AAA-ATPase Vps4-associated protein 1